MNPTLTDQDCQPAVADNLLDLIGNTPVVSLDNLCPNPDVTIYAKLEGLNPSGSIKDRTAMNLIREAEEDGLLDDDKVLLEPSSGNTGIGLAMISTIRGYELTIVMPESVTSERREVLRGFDVNIIESPADKGSNGAVFKARRLARENDQYIMLDQYANPANPRAHYQGTGQEILQQVDHIDKFIAGLGTGGTLMGVGRALREQYPDVDLIAIQPEPEEGLSGLRSLEQGFIPEIIDMSVLDGNELIRNEEAFAYVQELARKEGILSGISCGAAVAKCVKHARTMDSGTIVTVLPDAGWKYLSERLWSRSVDDLKDSVDGPLW